MACLVDALSLLRTEYIYIYKFMSVGKSIAAVYPPLGPYSCHFSWLYFSFGQRIRGHKRDFFLLDMQARTKCYEERNYFSYFVGTYHISGTIRGS